MYEPEDDEPRFKADQMSQAREHFMKMSDKMDQDWISGCTDCKLEEKYNGDSLRTDAKNIFKLGNGDGIRYLDMDISNTCNLMCRMCGPHSSSVWQQAVKQNPDLDWDTETLKSAGGKYGWHRDLDDVFALLDNVQLIKFTGGEPFLIPQHHQVVDHVISTGNADNIKYRVTTNGTVDISKYYDKLKLFKDIRISISLDAVGSRYEYIRPGAKWDQVQDNVLKIQQLAEDHNRSVGYEHTHVGIVPCLSILNFTKQSELRQWTLDNNLKWYSSDNGIGIEILDPVPLTFAALKPHLREKYNVETIFDYNESAWQKLLTQMKIQDKMFDTDFETECKELFD